MSETTENTSRIVVLGGGLAGLAAAHASLERGDCQVTVLEAEPEPGGMARSLEVEGLRSDYGPHRIYSCIPEMRQWFDDFLGDRLMTVERRSRMYFDDQWMRYPPSVVELVKVMGPGRIWHFGKGWISAKARSMSGNLPPDSFAAVMEANFGRPMCEALVFPYIRKTWKLEPDEISADAARARATMGGPAKMLKRMLNPREKPGEESSLREFHYIRGGIEELSRILVEKIEKAGGRVLTNAEVTQIDIEDGQANRVLFFDKDNHSHSLEADFIYSSIPITNLVAALKRGGHHDASRLTASLGLRYLRAMLAFLVLDREAVSEDHWLYFPQNKPAVTRAYEPKNFDESLAPRDRTLLCVEATDLEGGIEWMLRDRDLATEFATRVEETGVIDRKQVLAHAVRRIEHAYPLYEKGYRENVDAVFAGLKKIQNLLPIGRQGLFQHNNMDHTIYTALRAAQCRRESEKPTTQWYNENIPKFRDFRIVD
ncbi:MAG: FAD-dependent oxidoreductase [Candidatus Sumerlaeota bacterium]